jgi:hypothetical protein
MLIAVCSVKGSPGVTTFAIALAACWPQPERCVLVECDPSGGDVAIRFSLVSSPGLVSLAAAARRRTDPALLWQHTQSLPGGLPVVVAPPGADQARAALEALVPEGSSDVTVLRAPTASPGVVVIADCGRVDPASPVMPVARSADAMVLVSRAHADALGHLATRLATVGRWSRRPALVLTGPGYPTSAVERELGVPVIARVPEDRRGAAALSGRSAGRGPSRSSLGRTAARVAAVLAADPSRRPLDASGRPDGAVLRPVPNGPTPLEYASRNGSAS